MTVPSWPCTDWDSTVSGEQEHKAVWGGWASASSVDLMLSDVSALRWGVSRLGQGSTWHILFVLLA